MIPRKSLFSFIELWLEQLFQSMGPVMWLAESVFINRHNFRSIFTFTHPFCTSAAPSWTKIAYVPEDVTQSLHQHKT